MWDRYNRGCLQVKPVPNALDGLIRLPPLFRRAPRTLALLYQLCRHGLKAFIWFVARSLLPPSVKLSHPPFRNHTVSATIVAYFMLILSRHSALVNAYGVLAPLSFSSTWILTFASFTFMNEQTRRVAACCDVLVLIWCLRAVSSTHDYEVGGSSRVSNFLLNRFGSCSIV